MAKRHLEQYDSNGNKLEIFLNDDEVKVGNKTLAEKLDEIEDEIDGAGGYEPPQEGIPASDLAGDIPKAKLSQGVQDSLGKADSAIQGVTVNNTPVTPDSNKKVNITVPTKTSDLDNDSGFVQQAAVNSLQTAINSLQSALDTLIGSGNVQGAIDTFNEVTAFLNGISSSDTLAAKLAQIQQSIPSVDGFVTEQDVETMIDEAMEDVGGGSVESVTVSGTKYTPDENGDVDLGNLRGQDGNSGVASADGLESVNNLNGGTTDTQQKVYVLGANQGKRLRDQMEYLYGRLKAVYSLLAGIAFTDGKVSLETILPDLDWGNLKHTVTLDLDLTNAVVKYNGETKNDGDTILVEEGATLTLEVFANNNYQLSSVASQVGEVSGNVVTFVMGQSNVTLDITAIALATHNVNVNVNIINSLQEFNGTSTWTPTMGSVNDSNNESDTEVSNVLPVIDGGDYNAEVSTGNGYGIYNVQVLMGSSDVTASAYDPTTKEISIEGVTANISIIVTVRSAINGVFNGTSLHGRRGTGGAQWNSANAGRLVKDDDWCVMTDLVEIPDDATHIKWVYGADVMPASDVSVSDSPSWRRTLIHYGDDLVPLNFYTISSSNIANGERTRSLAVTTNGTADLNGNSKKTKYVRASFSIANLSQSKLQYSKDGSTWIDLWVGSEHIINNNNE